MAIKLDEAKKLVLDIDQTVAKLDQSVREKAFDILAGIAFSGKGTSPRPSDEAEDDKGKGAAVTEDMDDLHAFVDRFPHDREKDNVRLLAAWLYKQYGNKSFSLQGITALAEAAGLPIPSRVDMTLKGSMRNKKPLFQGRGRGRYQLAAEGRKYVTDIYEVKVGKKPRPTEGDE